MKKKKSGCGLSEASTNSDKYKKARKKLQTQSEELRKLSMQTPQKNNCAT